MIKGKNNNTGKEEKNIFLRFNFERIHKLSLLLLLVFFIFSNFDRYNVKPVHLGEESASLTQEAEITIQSGNLFIQISSIIIFVLALLLCETKFILKKLYSQRLFLCYFTFIALSLLYSINFNLTFRRLILFGIVVYFGLALLVEKDSTLEKFIKMFYSFILIYAFFAFMAFCRSIILGQIFFMYRFSVFGQPHRDAEIFGLGLLLHWLVNKEKIVIMDKILQLVLFMFMLLIVIITLSRTGLLCVLISGIYILNSQIKKISKKFLCLVSMIFLIYLTFLFLPNYVVEGLIRIETIISLAGRINLWEYLIEYGPTNPYFGAGFGAYWNADNIYLVELVEGWAAPGAHNGFLDVFVNTGLIGLIFILVILANLWISTNCYYGNIRTFLRAIVIFVIIQNLAQGSFQSPRMFVEIVFWWIYFQVVSRKIQYQYNARNSLALNG